MNRVNKTRYVRVCFIASFFSVSLSISMARADSSSVKFAGSLFGYWDGANSVAVAGNLAYLATYNGGFAVVDLTDRYNPRQLGFCGIHRGDHEIVITGDYAYVSDYYESEDKACNADICIIDIRDPRNPCKVGYIPHGCQGFALAGQRLYALEYSELRIWDIGDPTAPVYLGRVDLGYYGSSIIADRNYVYLTAYSQQYLHNLQILDVTDFASPIEVGLFQSEGFFGSISLAAGYLIAIDLDGREDGWAKMRVLDVSDPSSPREIGNCSVPSTSSQFVTTDSIACCISDYYGSPFCSFYDITSPEAPTFVSRLQLPVYSHVGLGWDFGCFADPDSGLRVIDLASLANPTQTAILNNPGNLYGVAASDAYAYIAAGALGVHRVNIVDSSHPRYAGSIEAGDARDVLVSGKYLFVADNDQAGSLHIFDCFSSGLPVQVGLYQIGWPITRIAQSGNLLLLMSDWVLLFILDVSNPASPLNVGSCEAGYGGNHLSSSLMAASEDVACIVTNSWSSGIGDEPDDYYHRYSIFDISDPSSPTLLTAKEEGGYTADLAISGDYLYLLLGSNLAVYDISDGSHPSLLATIYSGRYGTGITIWNNFAIIIGENRGLSIYDVSDPANPKEVGNCPTLGYPNDVNFSGAYAYVTSDWQFETYDCSEAIGLQSPVVPLPQAFALCSPYPNPFNSTICIPIELPQASHLSLRIFEMSGRRVTTLAYAVTQVGRRTLVWDAKYSASGLYFVKMETANFSATKTLMLIK